MQLPEKLDKFDGLKSKFLLPASPRHVWSGSGV